MLSLNTCRNNTVSLSHHEKNPVWGYVLKDTSPRFSQPLPYSSINYRLGSYYQSAMALSSPDLWCFLKCKYQYLKKKDWAKINLTVLPALNYKPGPNNELPAPKIYSKENLARVKLTSQECWAHFFFGQTLTMRVKKFSVRTFWVIFMYGFENSAVRSSNKWCHN